MAANNSNDRIWIFAVIGIVVVGVTLFFVFLDDPPQKFSWRETYNESSDQPYGLQILFALMDDHFEGHDFYPVRENMETTLPLDTEDPVNFLLVGDYIYPDRGGDFNHLLDFVANGNTCFLATKSIPYDLLYELDFTECYGIDGYESFSDSISTVNLTHPDLKRKPPYRYSYRWEHEPTNYTWNYIDTTGFCYDSYPYVRLGTINDEYLNFIKIPYGNGAFFLHSNPILFTNYYLVDREKVDYVEKVIAHLEDGDVYYGIYPKTYHPEISSERPPPRQNSGISSGGPLQYVLAQRSLRWAWYLILGLAALYFVFRSKRRQRIIPVIEPNTNTSLEFVETIGRLYYLQNDHKKLAIQKMRLFLAFLRSRYRLPTNKLDKELLKKIVRKSQLPESHVKAIFKQYQTIEKAPSINHTQLIEFHEALTEFYKRCK